MSLEKFRQLTREGMLTHEGLVPPGTHGPIVFAEPTGSVDRSDQWSKLPISSSLPGGQLAFPEELGGVMPPTDGAANVAPNISQVVPDVIVAGTVRLQAPSVPYPSSATGR